MAGKGVEKYFKCGSHLKWPEGAVSRESISAMKKLGHLKDEVHNATKFDLPNKDRKDSQGICFLGKVYGVSSSFTSYLFHGDEKIKIHVCWSWTLFPTINQGFPRENVKIIGERPLQGNRWNRMDQSYPIPDYCEPQALQGKFEIPILTLTMPKKTTSQFAPKQQEVGTSQENGEAKPTENV
ncbi:hypothetical protein JHK84_043193 [Glycine max]|nr:hypothetical protein JHK84_043193 [Glycine max]